MSEQQSSDRAKERPRRNKFMYTKPGEIIVARPQEESKEDNEDGKGRRRKTD